MPLPLRKGSVIYEELHGEYDKKYQTTTTEKYIVLTHFYLTNNMIEQRSGLVVELRHLVSDFNPRMKSHLVYVLLSESHGIVLST